MEGFTRIMQDGERQRALAPRPKASADHAVKTASRFGTKAIAADKATPATNSVPAAKATPAKKAWPLFKRRVFARKMDKRKHNEGTGTAEQNEAPMTPEQKEAPVTPERQTSAGNRLHGHVDDGVTEADEINELPTQKSIKQHKARPISWRAKEHSALPEECTFDTPVVGIARRGRYRHPLSITPSLATSIASDMESEIGSLHRSPSIISEHATAVQLTRVAPTEVAVHRHPRGQSNEEGHETVPVKENEFEISITAVSDAVSEVSERAETRGTVLVDDTAFELVRPEGLYYIAPPQHPAESFDRRTQARATPRLLTIALPDRNRIYEYLVVAEHDVVVGMQSEDGMHAPQQPAISRVSRQTRKESLTIFYSANRFMLEGIWLTITVSPWIRAIGPHNSSTIRHVELLTTNVATAINMMASVGFQLAGSLMEASRLDPVGGTLGIGIWLTFRAVGGAAVSARGTPESSAAVTTGLAVTTDDVTPGSDVRRLASTLSYGDIRGVARRRRPKKMYSVGREMWQRGRDLAAFTDDSILGAALGDEGS